MDKEYAYQYETGGLKFDEGKPPMGLLDRYALEEVAKVMGYGANKYKAHNWREGLAYSRLYDAALRHIWAFIDLEDNDPESGLPHIAHAICMLMFLLRMTRDRKYLDDRYPNPNGVKRAESEPRKEPHATFPGQDTVSKQRPDLEYPKRAY